MSFRDTASFGKRQEYRVVAELLRRRFDVYMTLVDDQGIDCIVRLDENRYVDVQIKARSRTAKNPFFFPALDFSPRANLFFMFYTELTDQFWTIPSAMVVQLVGQNKKGKNIGKISVAVRGSLRTGWSERMERYRDDHGFDLLWHYPQEPPMVICRVRLEWCTERIDVDSLKPEAREWYAPLLAQLQPGDQLWEYDEPAPPGVNAGELGVVLVRRGRTIDRVMTGVH